MRLRTAVAASLLVPCLIAGGGCSRSGAPVSSAAVTPHSTVAERIITLSLANGSASPSADRVSVPRGTLVTLQITSDRKDEVTIEGYGVVVPVDPGQVVAQQITVDKAGTFNVATKEPAATVLVIEVT